MSRKIFVLVDQSIKDLGGHHFEYAERVLNAARAQGFDTLLLAHRDFKDHKKTTHKVVPVFRRTFWENFTPSLPGASVVQAWRRWVGASSKRKSDARRRSTLQWTYSDLGYYALWAWDAMRHNNGARIVDTQGLAPDANRAFAIGARAAMWAWFAAKRNRYLMAVAGVVAKLYRSLFRIAVGVVALVLAPIVALATVIIHFATQGFAATQSASAAFEADLKRGLRRINPATIDYVFVPTLHTAELEGIKNFLVAKPNYQSVHWGLLYRRNIFNGLPDEYDAQIETTRPLRVAFMRCREALPHARISFFTDTTELTDQYDRLKVEKFHTVPVPSDFTFQRRMEMRGAATDTTSAPLTLSYLGDARDEKGYAVMLECQRALRNDYILPGRAKLLLQSNFNIPGGEPHTAAAHRFLRDCNNEGVELVYGPFDRDAYQALIARTDVLLIPYDQRNYSARSSGIFAEAVAAGIPSVVPAGTWMATLLEPERQKYLASTFASATASTDTAAILVDSIEIPPQRIAGGLFLDLPRTCNHAIVRVTISDVQVAYIDCWMTSLNLAAAPLGSEQKTVRYNGGDTRVPFRLKQVSKVWLRVKILARGLPLSNVKVHLDVFRSPAPLPLDVGGVISTLVGDGFAKSVLEVIDHHEHYAASAIQLSKTLQWLYDPALLLERLQDPSAPFGYEPGTAVPSKNSASVRAPRSAELTAAPLDRAASTVGVA